MARTLFEKLWQDHCIAELGAGTSLLYIDRILLHERTGSIALQSLATDGRPIHDAAQVFCVMDHIVDTFPGRGDDTKVPGGKDFILTTRSACNEAGITLLDVNDPRQGIVHVVSPELGIVQPGATLVCPDSHTCSQGALGALAWGIGSSEAEHALATGSLRVKKPATMRVSFNGLPGHGVSAKDLILHLISCYGTSGGAGYAIEFAGAAVAAMDIEARLTLCNMAVEFSAFSGVIAPDEKTYAYLQGRPYAPVGKNWSLALKYWRSLHSDADAVFDQEIAIDCGAIEPMISWGTNPAQACGIGQRIPTPVEVDSAQAQSQRQACAYMGLKPGMPVAGLPIDGAFIGSCTNSRLSDLRAAAEILRGRRVAAGVRAICVPGSTQIKRAAELEGLDKIFLAAGFEWRESGCSMCFYAGGESFGLRDRVVSSTNRNFESRQGPETRTHIASPATVAASAVAGCIADARHYPALAEVA